MADTKFQFSEWPPVLADSQLEELHLQASTYALSHGLLYLPVQPSLLPTRLFDFAQRIQSTYNVLYSRIAMDENFLDQVMGTEYGVGKVDTFTGQLWSGWKEIRDKDGVVQPLHLGLFRSDYLLHTSDSDGLALRQVEFNTISSSFGTLSEQVANLHRYLYSLTGYFNASSRLKVENFPSNQTTAGLAEGLAVAHAAYNIPDSQILFVVQSGERNVFDQRWLEYELLEKHSIHVIRQTFDELASSASVDPSTSALLVSSIEISTVYFRAGYTPTDYPTRSHYETRFLLECSKAINCPSIPLQLAGGKKVQQVLAQPGILERFLGEDFTTEQLEELRTSWMGMWGLDEPDGVQRARERSAGLVLKPQREGGGNNVYKESIPPFLDTLSAEESQAWIAMELIVPPDGLKSHLVRAELAGSVKTEVVSELGIFGWSLFGSKKVVEEKQVGWLVRTKGKDSDEGGVATGFSVLDSMFLVDD
ncbi:glutathione synthase [Guyanagaster necrorhizus]|uniref:Glutathione synthetase n=1 Tax=Guyanagaster necrorhizus TaxID=856835 RepID=A0A9P7VPC6_9AGAR|nr:glutathione synthase [Guyanagaster necrorhizus MCA 3950]KAG7443576.1 glutathione synthase [Guyanagaster necrorhizus MCA 3950]